MGESLLWQEGTRKRILHEHSYSVSPVHIETHLGGLRNTKTWVSKHLIRRFLDRREKASVKEVISLSRSESLTYARALLDRLKNNDILCVAADGRVGYKFVSVEFLGRWERFSTGMVSLARLTGASILPLFCIPGDDDRTLLIIEPPITTESGCNREESVETSVRHYASLFESYIRSYPGLYRGWRLSDTRQQGPNVPRATEEMTQDELDYLDPDYEVLIGIRAAKQRQELDEIRHRIA